MKNKKNSPPANTLFYNGVIYTADKNQSFAQCVAVTDGIITFVGSWEQGKELRDSSTQLVDLQGGMLLPSFMDTHVHAPGSEVDEECVINLTGIMSRDEIESKIRGFVEAHPDDEFYYGYGYNAIAFMEGLEKLKGPSKKRLDAIEPNKPMSITSYDGHVRWINSAAIEKLGITSQTVIPYGGFISLGEDGKPWGTLGEGAVNLVPDQHFTDDMKRSVLLSYLNRMNSWGNTLINDMAQFEPFSEGIWPFMKEFEVSGQLHMRACGVVYIDPDYDLDKQLTFARSMQEKYNSDLLNIGGIKLYADGVVDCHTACLNQPYSDQPDNCGPFLWDVNIMAMVIERANREGMQVTVHCIGDGATSKTLDAMEIAAARLPKADYRNSITHLTLVDEKDIPRFAKLGVIASAQPYWALKMPGYWNGVEVPFLGERAEKMYPFKSFLDAGVVLACSSDEAGTAAPYPLSGIQAGVTRTVTQWYAGAEYALKDMDEKPQYTLWPEQRLSAMEMVDSFTIKNAHYARLETLTGSIELGKSADLVRVNRNIFDINPVEIELTQVLATYLKGRLIYEKPMVGTDVKFEEN